MGARAWEALTGCTSRGDEELGSRELLGRLLRALAAGARSPNPTATDSALELIGELDVSRIAGMHGEKLDVKLAPARRAAGSRLASEFGQHVVNEGQRVRGIGRERQAPTAATRQPRQGVMQRVAEPHTAHAQPRFERRVHLG